MRCDLFDTSSLQFVYFNLEIEILLRVARAKSQT